MDNRGIILEYIKLFFKDKINYVYALLLCIVLSLIMKLNILPIDTNFLTGFFYILLHQIFYNTIFIGFYLLIHNRNFISPTFPIASKLGSKYRILDIHFKTGFLLSIAYTVFYVFIIFFSASVIGKSGISLGQDDILSNMQGFLNFVSNRNIFTALFLICFRYSLVLFLINNILVIMKYCRFQILQKNNYIIIYICFLFITIFEFHKVILFDFQGNPFIHYYGGNPFIYFFVTNIHLMLYILLTRCILSKNILNRMEINNV